jgi:hypothetical protein
MNSYLRKAAMSGRQLYVQDFSRLKFWSIPALPGQQASITSVIPFQYALTAAHLEAHMT